MALVGMPKVQVMKMMMMIWRRSQGLSQGRGITEVIPADRHTDRQTHFQLASFFNF